MKKKKLKKLKNLDDFTEAYKNGETIYIVNPDEFKFRKEKGEVEVIEDNGIKSSLLFVILGLLLLLILGLAIAHGK